MREGLHIEQDFQGNFRWRNRHMCRVRLKRSNDIWLFFEKQLIFMVSCRVLVKAVSFLIVVLTTCSGGFISGKSCDFRCQGNGTIGNTCCWSASVRVGVSDEGSLDVASWVGNWKVGLALDKNEEQGEGE
jgi:hypothetical protein